MYRDTHAIICIHMRAYMCACACVFNYGSYTKAIKHFYIEIETLRLGF